MDFLNVIFNILTSGLPCCLIAIGVFLTFRLLDFADMTAEGSFLLGASMTAACIYIGINPFLDGRVYHRPAPPWGDHVQPREPHGRIGTGLRAAAGAYRVRSDPGDRKPGELAAGRCLLQVRGRPAVPGVSRVGVRVSERQ